MFWLEKTWKAHVWPFAFKLPDSVCSSCLSCLITSVLLTLFPQNFPCCLGIGTQQGPEVWFPQAATQNAKSQRRWLRICPGNHSLFTWNMPLKCLNKLYRLRSSTVQPVSLCSWYVNQLVETWNLSRIRHRKPSHKCHINSFFLAALGYHPLAHAAAFADGSNTHDLELAVREHRV